MTAYTVAIPARDAAATIATVVRAAAAQQPAPARVLVGDDGSRDGTAELARAAGASIVAADGAGLAANRNRLWRASQTEIVMFFDADAVPRPGCAAALLDGFTDDRVGATGGRGIEAAAATFADRWRATHTPQSHGDAPIADDWMLMGLCGAFRRDALEGVGGFDERFATCGEDVEISWRLRRAGWRLSYRPDAIVDHARSDGLGGLLRQAWRHSRESGRALAAHGQPLKPLFALTWRALSPALRREILHLDSPAACLTAFNLAVRLAGLTAGAGRH